MRSKAEARIKEPKAPWSVREKMIALIIAALVVLTSVLVAVSVIDRLDRGIEFTVRTDKVQYEIGENISIHAEYVNHGYDTIELTFSSSLLASFNVFDSDGSPVCLIMQIGACVMVYETLEPGETLSGGCHWDQTNDLGELVLLSPGSYTISARSLCSELDLSASTTISIMG